MERSKVVSSDINVLSRIMWSVTSKRFLDFIDIASVITCIWMVFWLICFNFVTDFIEIITYATFKYLNRFIWLCKLLQLDVLLKRIDDFLETYELNYSTEVENASPKDELSENYLRTNVSVNTCTSEQPPITVLECTPCSFKKKGDINPRCIDFTEEAKIEKNSPSPGKDTILVAGKRILLYPINNSVSRTENAVFSTEENIICNASEHFDSNKNAISSFGQNVNKSTVNCEPGQNVNKSTENCEPDAVFPSPDRESGLKRNFFPWNMDTIRDSFRKESNGDMFPAVVKCKNNAGKVIQIQPTNEDCEKLVITNDSPVNAGCCNSLFITFKSKIPVNENVPSSVHYKRF